MREGLYWLELRSRVIMDSWGLHNTMISTQMTYDPSDEVPVPKLLKHARHGSAEALGQVLQLYRNYLTILATTQLDRRLRRRVNPSDLVQDAMLAAYGDFGKFQGCSERELLAWLRQILINCLHHVIETHLRAKMRDMRREISVEEVGAALDRSACNFIQTLTDRGPSPSAHASSASGPWPSPISSRTSRRTIAT